MEFSSPTLKINIRIVQFELYGILFLGKQMLKQKINSKTKIHPNTKIPKKKLKVEKIKIKFKILYFSCIRGSGQSF